MYLIDFVHLDVLRKLCGDGLSTTNYFETCAVYLLEYEKMLKDDETRQKSLKELIEGKAKLKPDQNKIREAKKVVPGKKV